MFYRFPVTERLQLTLFDDVQLAFAGRYQLESEIGEGGSARVFAAQDLKHDRRVAIKILKPGIAQGIAADRFLREIRMSAGLNHPRILPLFDSGEVTGLPYFVMPFIEGSTLRARMQREGTIGVADTVRIATQVADALTYLHERGFVHRDVKPENILLQGDHVWLADFGIVRALEDAATPHHTVDGLAIGTPAYMSPEQRLASPTLGGQSDEFSLAVVVYEMLVGRLPKLVGAPFDFTTPNGARFTPMHALRPDVPAVLDDVIGRALQVHEDARWPSMRAFAEKLAESSVPTPESTPAEVRRRPGLRYVAIAVAGLALLILAQVTNGRALDPNKLAVLPLVHQGESEFLGGDECSQLLRDAIAHWTGITQVDVMRLHDLRKSKGVPQSVDGAMKMANGLGAGLAIWGTVGADPSRRKPSGRLVHVYLYKVRSGRPTQEAKVVVDTNDDLAEVFQLIADSLMSGEAGRPPGTPVAASRDVNAMRAYLKGHMALDSFNLAEATQAFRRAIKIDSGFGLAHLWLAWSTLWLDGDARVWGAAARSALSAGRLTSRDSTHAQALVNLNERRLAQACIQYRSLTDADSTDFAAWYGLGECLSLDNTVVPSTNSPSGWAFQTSTNEAVRAYQRALDLVPSLLDAMGTRALERISRWLYLHMGRYRIGTSADSQFAAWPSLSGDTLAFIPFYRRDVDSSVAGTKDPTFQLALRRNRERLLDLVNRRLIVDSTNALALETLALAREANDELTQLRRPEPPPALTGIAAVRRARAYAGADAAPRLAATEVRFLIKADQHVRAKDLADSLLRRTAVDSANPATASYMYAVAMLTGRVQDALWWGRRSTFYQYTDRLRPDHSISPSLSSAASDAATFAAIDARADSTSAALGRVEALLLGQIEPSAEVLRQQYVELPRLYAWPLLGRAFQPPTRAMSGNTWLRVQLAVAGNDTALARTLLLHADSAYAREGYVQLGFELALATCRLWLAVGDSTKALDMARLVVERPNLSGDQITTQRASAASYVRLLILQSSLAWERGDSVTARNAGTRAWALWRDEDPMIAEAMRPIARWRNIPIPGGIR